VFQLFFCHFNKRTPDEYLVCPLGRAVYHALNLTETAGIKNYFIAPF
jgi:hypothetical protein